MNLQEDIHAIRQSLERLVHHFASNKRSGAINHRDGQRDSTLQRETESKRTQEEEEEAYIVRSIKKGYNWGPFKGRGEAQIWLNKKNCNSKDFTIEVFWLV